MRKEDNEKPVNQAKEDLSFSPAIGWWAITISGSRFGDDIAKV